MRSIRVLEGGFCGGFAGLFAGKARSHKDLLEAEFVGAGRAAEPSAREEALPVTPQGTCP
ncbi:hypothetical protein AHFPHNDE_01800 [Pseudomonas sp. MM227]|nr:hypothetical protein AHFPHNDE_01800 [Pseudomonas sp. MM227]